jgi:hypothetical protein
VLIALLMLGFFIAGRSGSIGPPAQAKSAVDQTSFFVDNMDVQTINAPFKLMADTALIGSLTKEPISAWADIYLIKNLKETEQMTATFSELAYTQESDGQQPPVPVMEVPYDVICPSADVLRSSESPQTSTAANARDGDIILAEVAYDLIMPIAGLQHGMSSAPLIADKTRPTIVPSKDYSAEVAHDIRAVICAASLNHSGSWIDHMDVAVFADVYRTNHQGVARIAAERSFGSSYVIAAG